MLFHQVGLVEINNHLPYPVLQEAHPPYPPNRKTMFMMIRKPHHPIYHPHPWKYPHGMTKMMG
uniref:Uncharacterized protein n=1 Tax=Ciona savignyi TaxID=51511 RepID=H2Y979_CIOSA